MRTLFSIGIIVAVMLAGWWYFDVRGGALTSVPAPDSGGIIINASAPDQTATSSPLIGTSTSVTASSTNAVDISVNAFDYGFDPSTITVKKGQDVRITVNDTGGLQDFVINAYNVRTPRLETGQNAVVEFVADQSGTFDYYSSVGNHRAMGMWGTLIVTP